VAMDGDDLWVTAEGDKGTAQIFTEKQDERGRADYGGEALAAEVAEGRLWILVRDDGEVRLEQFETAAARAGAPTPERGHPVGADDGTGALTVGFNNAWATNGTTILAVPLRDPNAQPRRFGLKQFRASALAFEQDKILWVGTTDGHLLRFDGAQLTSPDPQPQVFPVAEGKAVESIAIDNDFLWAADDGEDVHRVDLARPEKAPDAVPIGAGRKSLLTVNGDLWVASGGDGGLYRVDPDELRVDEEANLGDALDEGSS
jgi:ligand-binding sensor domain-containing protein